MRKRIFCLAAAFLLLTGCGLLPQEKQRQQAPVLEQYAKDRYVYTEVSRGTVTLVQSASTTVTPTHMQELAFQEKKREVIACYVRIGSQVEEGMILAELACDDLEEQLQTMETSISLKQLELSYQQECDQLELGKQNLLLSRMSDETQIAAKKQQIISLQQQYADQEQALSVQLQELQLQKKSLEQQVDACVLRAGISGIVNKIGADQRSFVIEDLADSLLQLQKSDAERFPVGTVVTVLNEDQEDQGEVIEQDGERYVRVLSPSHQYASGARCTVSFEQEQRTDTLYLPSGALRKNGGKDCVYIIGEDGLITTHPVTVGLVGNELTEILSGLSEGDQVVLKQ